MRDYNFFEIYDKKKGVHINPKTTFFIIVLIIIISTSMGTIIRNLYFTSKINSITERIGEIEASKKYEEANFLQDSIIAMENYDKQAEVALKKFHDANILSTEFLDKLVAVLPTSVSVSSYNMSSSMASIRFNIPDNQSGTELLYHLKNSGLFINVHLISIEANEDTPGFIATIQCYMKAGEKYDKEK